MPASLTNTNISTTYLGVLHSNGEQLPTSGQQRMSDGAGNTSAISIGRDCNGVTICGPLSCTSLQTNQKISTANIELSGVVNHLYPVGSVFFSLSSENPSVRFTGTTWVRVAQGRFIAGEGIGVDCRGTSQVISVSGTDITDTTGEYKHQLTEIEMPNHRHLLTHPDTGEQFYVINDSNFSDGSSGTFRADGPEKDKDGRYYPYTNYTGGSLSHNNTPPSFGLYIWQRTA
jgi:hypothetical protein